MYLKGIVNYLFDKEKWAKYNPRNKNLFYML